MTRKNMLAGGRDPGGESGADHPGRSGALAEPGLRSMTVRDARMEDAAVIAAIQVAGWKIAYRGILPDRALAELDVTQREARWREILAGSTSREIVAEEDGIVRAFLSDGPVRDADAPAGVREIYALYADPDAWGRGFGRALWTELESRLRETGCREVTLWVLEANARARRFYESLGFVRDGATQSKPDLEATECRYRRSIQAG
jgi:ribosomal protein S18 acetylase RimI-like enzyme